MRLSIVARNAQLNALGPLLNNGYARGFSGTRPVGPDSALSGNTQLFQCGLSGTAFQTATGGTMTANAISADSDNDNTGTLSFVRLYASDGTTAHVDLSVGVGSGEFQVSTTAVTIHGTTTPSSCVITGPLGT